MSTDKVIVTCALTGVLANRDQCPWVPYTPVEIAEEARRAYEAGAAIVHIHARTDEGSPTYEPSVYAAIRREIEQRWPLLDKGLLKEPLQFSFIMGVLGGIRATTENLALQARETPQDSTWEVIGISHEQWRMLAAALSLGGNVRVGLEDNFYLDSAGKEMARSNGELVAKAVRMARDMGREPANVAQA